MGWGFAPFCPPWPPRQAVVRRLARTLGCAKCEMPLIAVSSESQTPEHPQGDAHRGPNACCTSTKKFSCRATRPNAFLWLNYLAKDKVQIVEIAGIAAHDRELESINSSPAPAISRREPGRAPLSAAQLLASEAPRGIVNKSKDEAQAQANVSASAKTRIQVCVWLCGPYCPSRPTGERPGG